MECSVSIVVPVFNEVPDSHHDEFSPRIQALCQLLRPCDELILVDGGSTDASWPTLQRLNEHPQIIAIQAPKGRARQMNAGATVARGEILLFLHADTALPFAAWHSALKAWHCHQGQPLWGRFDVRIQGKSPWLPVVACFMNFRSRLTKIATGDQAFFIDSKLFKQVGGFPEQPLMEDVEMCKRLKRLAAQQFVAVRDPVETSGRRWDTQGAWRTILLMWRFRFLYWRGVPAAELARQYADARQKQALTVAVFAKYPAPGRVKTRLQPLLGAQRCAEFARYLLLNTLDKLHGVPTVVWTDGADPAQWDDLLQGREVTRCVQPQGHLGQRMQAAVETHLKHSEVVVLLGPDAVQFTRRHLNTLVKKARRTGLAIVPALDGGYVALACTRCEPAIFSGQINWGSSSVAMQTREALATCNSRAQWLPAQIDIDEPADYAKALELGHIPANWAERYGRPVV